MMLSIFALFCISNAQAMRKHQPEMAAESSQPITKKQCRAENKENSQPSPALLTICTADESCKLQLPKTAIDRCQTIKNMIEDIDWQHQRIHLSPAITAEQFEQFVPVLIKFDEVKKTELSSRDKEAKILALLQPKPHLDLCMIAHAANAVECKELLETVCEVFAQKLKTPEMANACLAAGGFELTINKDTNTQIALDIQRLIGCKMFTAAERDKIAMNELLINNGRKETVLRGQHVYWTYSSAYNIANDRIVSITRDDTIKIWDGTAGTCLRTLEGHTNLINSAVFNTAGDRMVSASADNTIKIWDVATGICLHTLYGHTETVNSAMFNDGEDYIVSTSHDNTIKIWDVATGTCLRTLQGHTNWVLSANYNHMADRIVSASRDNTIKIWDAETGNCLGTLHGHTNVVNLAAFNSTGDLIVSASADETIKIWDAATGTCLRTLHGHTNMVNSAAFNNTGDRIVSASDDRTIKIWDVETGTCLRTLHGYDRVNSAVFNSAGDRIVSAFNGGTIKISTIFNLETEKYLTKKILPSQAALLLMVGAQQDSLNNLEQTQQIKMIVKTLPLALRRAFFSSWNHLNPWVRHGVIVAGSSLAAAAAGFAGWYFLKNKGA